MLDKKIIYEYDELLIGNRKLLPQCMFNNSDTINMRLALDILKYAFENYLHWTPIEICDWITMPIIEILKLRPILKYIEFPAELDRDTDLFYLARCIYPNVIQYSMTDTTCNVFKKVLNKSIQKYPKEFFTGIYGMNRAMICLRYVIAQYIPVNNQKDLYALFADSHIWETLSKYKLSVACKDLFESPIDFLHQSLHPSQRNNALFLYYVFEALQNADKTEFSLSKEDIECLDEE